MCRILSSFVVSFATIYQSQPGEKNPGLRRYISLIVGHVLFSQFPYLSSFMSTRKKRRHQETRRHFWICLTTDRSGYTYISLYYFHPLSLSISINLSLSLPFSVLCISASLPLSLATSYSLYTAFSFSLVDLHKDGRVFLDKTP